MSDLNGPRVLVVDVDDDLRSTLCEVLSDAGFQPTCVPDVETARATLPQDPPNVLLLCRDAHAGAADKAALVEDAPDGTSVVLMSTHPTVATVAERLGVPLIAKPFDLDEFLATVERRSRRSPP